MKERKTDPEKQIGAMQKRRETMADGRRYIIYYTFENSEELSIETSQNKAEAAQEEKNENV
jgi:hypothetical protein